MARLALALLVVALGWSSFDFLGFLGAGASSSLGWGGPETGSSWLLMYSFDLKGAASAFFRFLVGLAGSGFLTAAFSTSADFCRWPKLTSSGSRMMAIYL
jgi:hypothetical protein